MAGKKKKMKKQAQPLDESQAQGTSAPEGEQLGGVLGAILGGMTQGQAPHSPPPSTGSPAQGGDEVLGRLSDAPMMGQGSSSSAGAPQSGAPQSGDPLSDLLGSMMGGGGQGSAPAGGDLGSILGGLMGGATQGSSQGGVPGGSAPQGGDPLSDLLGSMMGGGGGMTPSNTGSQTNDPLGGLLGGLLGGMMGGGAGSTPSRASANSMGGLGSVLSPLADKLAEKTGIPPEIAMAAMTIIVPMLLKKLTSSGQQAGGDPLSSLGGSMRKQGLTFTPDEQGELINQLSAQTGLDEQSATHTLNQAMQLLGSQG